MGYLAVKHAHLTFAALSFAGFLLRAWWMWRDSLLLQHRLTRTIPHVNDSLLLAAGAWLAFLLHQYPGNSPWLTAKLAALILYIVLGSIALKRGKTRRIRALALSGSVLVFAYIAAVALTRNPWPVSLI